MFKWYYNMKYKLKLKKLIMSGVKIGRNTNIFTNISNFGSEPYLVHIGDNCAITDNVRFITHDGAIRTLNHMEKYKHIDNKYGKIDIKDNCFIGIEAIIMPGVTIGPNSIVGAGAVVHKSMPPDSCIAGNPARVICTLEEYRIICEQRLIPGYAKNINRKREFLEEYFWSEPEKQ